VKYSYFEDLVDDEVSPVVKKVPKRIDQRRLQLVHPDVARGTQLSGQPSRIGSEPVTVYFKVDI